MKNSINDDEAEVLLAGRTPEGRPDFDELAASIASFRSATFEMVPRPSAVLAARLGLPQEELVTATSTAASTGRLAANCPDAAFAARVPRSSAMTRMIERVSDLSLAAKIAAGMGVLALGITVAGAAHALPGGLQNAFDNFVSTVISVEGNDEVVIVDEHMTGGEVDPAEQTLPDDGDEANSSLMDDVEVGDETEIGTDSERDDAGEEPGTGAGTSGSGT